MDGQFYNIISLGDNQVTELISKVQQPIFLGTLSGEKLQIVNLNDPSKQDQLFVLNDNTVSSTEIVQPVTFSQETIQESFSTCQQPQDASGIGTTHKNEAKKANPIQCPICAKVFPRLSHYWLHIKYHCTHKKFQCNVCTKAFNKESNYNIHMVTHEGGTPRCPVCNRIFQRIASLKAHLATHEVAETYNCFHCNADFEKEDDLLRHLHLHEGEEVDDATLLGEDSLRCLQCSYVFDDAAKYKEHIRLHVQARRVVNSAKCRTRRKTKSRKEWPHKCVDCAKTFSKLCLLERHRRTHTGERPYVCRICKRGFTQKGAMQIHIARHEGHKPHKCMFCAASFVQKGNLIAHLQKTHTADRPGDKLFKCPHCTCVYKKISSLNGHVTRVHANNEDDAPADIKNVMAQLKTLERQLAKPPPKEAAPVNKADDSQLESKVAYVKIADSSIDGNVRTYVIKQRTVGENRWYTCSFCNKEFKKPSDLIRHMRIHTREKPYECSECGVTFAQKNTLTNHLATHAKNEYECVICRNKFGSIRSLNVHLKRHDETAVARRTQCYKCSTCEKTFDSIDAGQVHMKVHEVVAHDDDSDVGLRTAKELPDKREILQPLVETDCGLRALPPPKPRLPLATYDEYRSRPFKCHLCNAAFQRNQHLKKHMFSHSSVREFTCSICAKQFVTASALREHVSYHTKTKSHRCTVCTKAFFNASMLRRHLAIHKSARPFICPHCGKRFRAKEHCRKHIGRHQVTDTAPLRTHVANEPLLKETAKAETAENEMLQFDLNQSMKNIVVTDMQAKDDDIPQIHIKENENASALLYDIDPIQLLSNAIDNQPGQVNYIGGGLFAQNYPISTLLQPNTVVNQFNPNIILSLPNMNVAAPISQDTMRQLSMNLNATSAEKATDVISMEKPQNYLNLVNYLPTQQDVQSLSATPVMKSLDCIFICTKCNSNISTLDLLNHNCGNSESHQPQIAFIQAVPNYNAQSTNTMQENMITIHDGAMLNSLIENNLQQTSVNISKESVQPPEIVSADEKSKSGEDTGVMELEPTTFRCDHCMKEFKDRATLNRHAAAKHREELDRCCQYCSKIFKKKSDMERHIRTHTGEKPFHCHKCDKSFAIKSTLNSHLRTHEPTEAKAYECKVCGSRFVTRSTLKTHQLIHGDKKSFTCELCDKTFRHAHHKNSHLAWHAKRAKKPPSAKINALNILQSFVMETNDKIHEEQQLQQQQIVTNEPPPPPPPDALLSPTNLFTTDLAMLVDNHSEPLTIRLAYDPSQLINFVDAESITITNDNVISMQQENDPLETTATHRVATVPVVASEEKKFQCDVCNKFYVSNAALRKHQRALHGAHKCDKCTRTFNTPESLQKHYSLHELASSLKAHRKR